MTALAIICAYNEADVIGWTVRHLKRQGCDVLVIDCQSTDGTRDVAEAAGAQVTDYDAPPVSWHALLGRVELIAACSSRIVPPNVSRVVAQYDWLIHCDADELRYSDYGRMFAGDVEIPGESLVDGFARVQADGYNAIDHTVLTFHPTADTAAFDGTQDPETYFRYYSGDPLNQRIGQVKAWRNLGPVSLAHSGGHQADFPGRRVYPGRFLSKHYPIRSQAHGERKVFQERQWLDQQQGRRDWHVQYQGIKPGHSFLKDPAELQEWK